MSEFLSGSELAAGDPLYRLLAIAATDPHRPFIQTGARCYTYSSIADLSARLAARLSAQGVRSGDRVAAQIDKSAEAVALYLACLRLGAAFVPLNTAYTLAELEYFIGDSQPSVTVVLPASFDQIARVDAIRSTTRIETLGDGGEGSLLEFAENCDGTASPVHDARGADLAALLYTSGTTGRSKGAMLSRGNLASNAATLSRAWEFTAQDVLLHALPIFHVHGLFVAINTVLASGSAMIFTPKFDVEEVLQLLPRATVMMGVPTFYTRLLQHPQLSRNSTRNIRLFVSGSAPLLAETHREFNERTGHAILERYGMSETLMNTSNPYRGERVPGSVGPPLPGVEVRITTPENGAPVASQSVGMIEVRGPNVFSGYWRMPEKTASELRSDGFFITGDLGKIDERGYVHIIGRGKDLIITGGYNVYPIEVENEIDALPGVVESAVIGVAHADFGEGVTAIVVKQVASAVDEATVLSALQHRLAKYKLPKRVVFVDELPRNTMGKVQKSALREHYQTLYSERPGDRGMGRVS